MERHVLSQRALDDGELGASVGLFAIDDQRHGYGAVEATRSSAMTPPLLDVRGVTLQYKTRDHLVTATYRVDFEVLRSDRFVLLGPSGCGKSTLLKAVGGYMSPVEGEIRLKGEPVGKPGPDRMMVFQEFDQLLPWKTVKQNVMFPLIASGTLTRPRRRGQGDATTSRR